MAISFISNKLWACVPDSFKNYGPTLAQGAVILVTIHQIATKGILAPPVFLTHTAIPIGVGCMVVAPFLCNAIKGLARGQDFSEDFGFDLMEVEEEGSTEEPVQNKKPSSIEKALDIGKALWEVTWRGCLVHGLIQKGLIEITNTMIPKAAAAFFNTGLSYAAVGSITAISAASAWKTHRHHVFSITIGPSQTAVNIVTAFALNAFYGVLTAKGGLTSAIAAHATSKVIHRLFPDTIDNCFTSAKEWYAKK